MLKPFLSHSSQQNFTRWVLIAIMLVILILFEVIKVNDNLVIKGRELIMPVIKLEIKMVTSLHAFAGNISTFQSTARRVQDLEIKLAYAMAQLSQLEKVKQENEHLRQLLNSSNRTLEPVVITSPVLSLAKPAVKLPLKLNQTEIAVKPGSPVLVHDTLIGVVSSFSQDVAYIDLLWHKDCLPILAETSNGVQGIIRGDGKRVLLTEVPTDAELEVGQRVVTSGQAGIDQGLYIGEIQSLRSGLEAAVKTAVIEQYVSFYEAEIVEIR
jgi:cell shape-determining protein MreC